MIDRMIVCIQLMWVSVPAAARSVATWAWVAAWADVPVWLSHEAGDCANDDAVSWILPAADPRKP